MRALIAFVVIYPSLLGVLFALLFSFARYFAVPKDQKRTEWFIIATALAIPANIAAEAVTKWISILRPLKYDLYIFHIDGLLGFQPSFSIGRLTICISAIPHRHSQHRGASDLSLCAAERDPVGSLLDGPADRLVRETLAFGSPSGNRLCSNHGNRDAWIRPALFSRSLAGCSVCDSGLSDMQSWLCCGQIGPPLLNRRRRDGYTSSLRLRQIYQARRFMLRCTR